jgi:hypothetical protein
MHILHIFFHIPTARSRAAFFAGQKKSTLSGAANHKNGVQTQKKETAPDRNVFHPQRPRAISPRF